MLKITVPGVTGFDEETNRFVQLKKPKELKLEHSLVSLRKWESKWKKPFLNHEHSGDELLDYIRFMTITQNVDEDVYERIAKNEAVFNRIDEYIHDPMTATTIHGQSPGNSNRTITAELVYCWMIQLGIPDSYEKWHLNQLLMLIRVCGIEMNKGNQKKMPMNEIYAQNRKLNAARRKAMHSKG